MDLRDRICKYLACCPSSVSGNGGHNQTFAIACSLVNGFALDEESAFELLKLYSDRCQPPWSEVELRHKVKSALNAVHDKPRGHLIGGNGHFKAEDFKTTAREPKPSAPAVHCDPATEIEKFLGGFRCSEADLADTSPIPLSEDWTQDGALLVSHLYQPGELVNFVTEFKLSDCKNGLTKAVPKGYGHAVERDELAATWSLTGMPQSEAGGWMRMNPTDGGGVGDKNITAFRYILFEFDELPLDLQMAFFAKLPLPIAAILASGGKSLHAWVRADCDSAEEYRKTVLRLVDVSPQSPGLLTRFGLDTKNKNPSRLSRMAGVTRTIGAADDGRQRLLYLSPNPTMKPIL